ncbi:carbon monoxide dehydrogenase [Sulfodiicoccus acidiphilus]|uniref:Carbon monoxide dehydrogenase n=1 Tax=Sulfodiicoccus acidiphilus TaxID=1670455 RepID=A0A830H262_9CREN|nr:carbon monoxide dehydrogenase subunit G [Sulfodiicoccus acidiphilus]GGT94423.1 carbon monoxide dehydrogenase [Sulfodiicoccus acidiphilus]
MQFQGSFKVNSPKEKVWEFLTSPEKVASCFPGLNSINKEGDGYKISLRLGVGPIKGDFKATMKYSEVIEGKSVTINARGTGMSSNADLTARVELNDGTPLELKWAADVKVGGVLASVGSRMMEGVANKIVDELFQCLKGKLES